MNQLIHLNQRSNQLKKCITRPVLIGKRFKSVFLCIFSNISVPIKTRMRTQLEVVASLTRWSIDSRVF